MKFNCHIRNIRKKESILRILFLALIFSSQLLNFTEQIKLEHNTYSLLDLNSNNLILIYTHEVGLKFLNEIYSSIFNQGSTIEEKKIFKRNFEYCARNYKDPHQQIYRNLLKEFYFKCYELKNNVDDWNNEIIKEFIIKGTNNLTITIENKMYSCGKWLNGKLLPTPKHGLMAKTLEKEFNTNLKNNNVKMVSSMYHQYRNRLAAGSMTKLNEFNKK